MTGSFSHHPSIRAEFPTLAAGVLLIEDVQNLARPEQAIGEFEARAVARLNAQPESEFAEIQAWRRAFSQMGLKPTQYRCAAEALLRRLRKEHSLPRLHPLVDLCNAASAAYAIPVAVFDRDTITGDLIVQHAQGDEDYLNFAGDHEHPSPDEVIFADSAGHAHARRWTNRQSARSATRPATQAALVVAEALHHDGQTDIFRLLNALGSTITRVGHAQPSEQVLTQEQPSAQW